MSAYTLTHLSDASLLRDLATLVMQDRLTTAALLAHIAEVDARRLYVPAGYASMHAYCVEELHISEEAAFKRIRAARAARRFPLLFGAVADGRLHLSAVCLLASHLTPENVGGLVATASHRGKSEIEEMLSRAFPLLDASGLADGTTPVLPALGSEYADGDRGAVVCQAVSGLEEGCDNQLAPGPVVNGLTRPGLAVDQRSEVTSALAERIPLNLVVSRITRDKLRYAQTLLSHAVPSGDPAQVLDRALDVLITQLEKRKFGGRARQNGVRASEGARARLEPRRAIPAHVRRAVWERDQGQCTFVGAAGHRCASRRFLEFDHVEPVARGGAASVDGIRLRCRAHNQHEAERAFGAEFMEGKRREARLNVDVVAGLRALGCGADEARRAAVSAAVPLSATLEERMRGALQCLGRKRINTCSES